MKNYKNLLGLLALICAGAFVFASSNVMADTTIPEGWVETEYVYSYGGGYVKTDLAQSATNTLTLDSVWEVTENLAESRRMGFSATQHDYFMIKPNNYFGIYIHNTVPVVQAQLGAKYHLHQELNQSITNTSFSVYSYDDNPTNEVLLGVCNTSTYSKLVPSFIFHIFRAAGSYVGNCKGIRVYSFKVYFDGVLVGDFIPVRSEKDNEGAFFDRVRGKIYKGSGGLILSDMSVPPFNAEYGSGDTLIRAFEGCLYLPSNANYDNLDGLNLTNGAILSGTVEGVAITNGVDTLDFRRIFGQSMSNGITYRVNVRLPDNSDNFFSVIKSEGTSSLYVTLDDGKTIDWINSNKKNECSAVAVKVLSNGVSSASLVVKKFAGRGNYSWVNSGQKKSYKINFSNEYALISSRPAAKKFAINGCNVRDFSGLEDALAHDFVDTMDPGFNIGYEYADLYVNGEYRGMYLMLERVTVGEDRVDITKAKYAVEDRLETTRVLQVNGIKGRGGVGDPDDVVAGISGFAAPNPTYKEQSTDDSADPALAAGIQAYQYSTSSELEENGYGGICIENSSYGSLGSISDSPCFFVTKKGAIFTFKLPEYATKEQVQTMAKYFQEAENALFSTYGFNAEGKHYSEYFDVDSNAKHFIVDGFMGNGDFYDQSYFQYIDADNVTGEFIGKMIAEPCWDYDWSFLNISKLYHSFFGSYQMLYPPQFFKQGDFVGKMAELTRDGGSFRSYVNNILDEGKHQARINSMKPLFALNKLRWEKDSLSYALTDFSYLTARRSNYFSLFNAATKILGVSVSVTNEPKLTLQANVSGTATALQWYRSITNTIEELEGETEVSIDPSLYGKGRYFCGATGGNIAYGCGGAGVPYVSESTITLYSAPYDYTLPEPMVGGIVIAFLLALRARKMVA